MVKVWLIKGMDEENNHSHEAQVQTKELHMCLHTWSLHGKQSYDQVGHTTPKNKEKGIHIAAQDKCY